MIGEIVEAVEIAKIVEPESSIEKREVGEALGMEHRVKRQRTEYKSN